MSSLETKKKEFKKELKKLTEKYNFILTARPMLVPNREGMFGIVSQVEFIQKPSEIVTPQRKNLGKLVEK